MRVINVFVFVHWLYLLWHLKYNSWSRSRASTEYTPCSISYGCQQSTVLYHLAMFSLWLKYKKVVYNWFWARAPQIFWNGRWVYTHLYRNFMIGTGRELNGERVINATIFLHKGIYSYVSPSSIINGMHCFPCHLIKCLFFTPNIYVHVEQHFTNYAANSSWEKRFFI